MRHITRERKRDKGLEPFVRPFRPTAPGLANLTVQLALNVAHYKDKYLGLLSTGHRLYCYNSLFDSLERS